MLIVEPSHVTSLKHIIMKKWSHCRQITEYTIPYLLGVNMFSSLQNSISSEYFRVIDKKNKNKTQNFLIIFVSFVPFVL